MEEERIIKTRFKLSWLSKVKILNDWNEDGRIKD